jgi:hypothetical protein
MQVTIEVPHESAHAQAYAAFEQQRAQLFKRLADYPHPADWQLSDEDAALVMGALTMQQVPAGAVEVFVRWNNDMHIIQRRMEQTTLRLQRLNVMHFWGAMLLSACFVATYMLSGRLADLFAALVWSSAFGMQLWLRYRKPADEALQ